MALDARDAQREILLRRLQRRGHFLRFRARQQIVARDIQGISQKAKRFQARLTEPALIKADGIQALSDDVRQRLLAHVFGGSRRFQTLPKLDHN